MVYIYWVKTLLNIDYYFFIFFKKLLLFKINLIVKKKEESLCHVIEGLVLKLYVV